MLAFRVPPAVPLALAAIVAAGAGVWAQREPLPFSPTDADRFTQKMSAIARHDSVAPRRRAGALPVRTAITEPELNAYLRYRIADQLPQGLSAPLVLALGDGRLAGRADLDLDAVRLSRPRDLFDPMRYLSGRMPVAAAGVLQTRAGVGQFQLESASVSGVSVPRTLLQELVSYYSRTSSSPEGIDLAAPFDLPAGIREIEVRAGQAVILQ